MHEEKSPKFKKAGIWNGFLAGHKTLSLNVLFLFCAGAILLRASPVRAEEAYNVADPYATAKAPTPWYMGFALSFPNGTGPTASLVDGGFGLDFFGGYQKPDRVLGIRMDVMYESFKLSDTTITRLANATEGSLRVFGGGPSLVVSPTVGKWLRPSIYAGPGVYYQDASALWEDSCDPIFGCQAGGADYTSANMTTTRLGWQGGVGLDLLFDGGLGSIGVHVQYVTINNTNTDIEFIPINIGYKVAF